MPRPEWLHSEDMTNCVRRIQDPTAGRVVHVKQSHGVPTRVCLVLLVPTPVRIAYDMHATFVETCTRMFVARLSGFKWQGLNWHGSCTSLVQVISAPTSGVLKLGSTTATEMRKA